MAESTIFIWSWPATAASVLGKCMSNVDDVEYWHDPYGSCHNMEQLGKLKTDALSPKLQEYFGKVMQTAASPEGKAFFEGSKLLPGETFKYPVIKEKLEEELTEKKFRVVKELARSIVDHEKYLAKVPARHVFLIRHPYRIFASLTRQLKDICQRIGVEVDFEMFRDFPSFTDYTTYDHCHILWKHLQDTHNVKPLIIDSEDLVNHADKVLPELFRYCGIPFQEKYLKWSADEEILKTWNSSQQTMIANYALKSFDRAFKSSSFVPHKNPLPKKEDLPAIYRENIDQLVKHYEEMYSQRFKPS